MPPYSPSYLASQKSPPTPGARGDGSTSTRSTKKSPQKMSEFTKALIRARDKRALLKAKAARPVLTKTGPGCENGDVIEIFSDSGQADASGEVIEISDTSEEDLANPPLQPGDSVYRGRGIQKSRIASVQSERETSPAVTRRRAKLLTSGALLPAAKIEPKRKQDNDGSAPAPKRVRRTPRRNTTDHTPKNQKNTKYYPPVRTSPDDPPETSEAIKTWWPSQNRVNQDVTPATDVLNDQDDREESLVDGYDTGDSFIDDTQDAALSTHSENDDDELGDSHDAFADDGEEWGGVTSSVEDCDNMGDKGKVVSKTPQRVVRESTGSAGNYGYPTPTTPKQFRSKPVASYTTPTRKHLSKGKSRATVISDDEDDAPSSTSSQYERDLKTAIENSKIQAVRTQPKRGSTSNAPGSSQGGSSFASVIPTTPVSSLNSLGPSTPLPKIPADASLTPAAPPLNGAGQAPANPPAVATQDPQAPSDPSIHHFCVDEPEHDEVNDESLQDELLAADYKDLPKLRAGELLPLNIGPTPGHPSFSGWKGGLEGLNFQSALNAIRFVEVVGGQYVNPSRASPVRVDCKEIVPGKKYNLMRNRRPLIAVVSGYLDSSQLTHLGTGPVKLKNVKVNSHDQEWQRDVSWSCSSFGRNPIYGHLWNDSFPYSTRSVPSESSAKPQIAGLFKKGGGSASSAGAAADSPLDPFSLPHLAEVPVYDARNQRTIDFNVDLPSLSSFLPRFQGEIPTSSLVVVGHTRTLYLAGSGPHAGKWTLGCNLLWVILLGTPNADAVAKGKQRDA